MKRREEMGREQLDRTKRFTDDGKLRGMISSAKFVPECILEEKNFDFGQLFKVRDSKDEDVERQLDIIDGEKVVKKRKFANPKVEIPITVLNLRWKDTLISKIPLDQTRSKVATPQPEEWGDQKRRRVQFAVDL